MTPPRTPSTPTEWSRRAIINVVQVLAHHADCLTLIGAHAVLLRTADLDSDLPMMPTGDGDLGVTPGLVGDVPSLETLLRDAGYEHRTTARPGLWGRDAVEDVRGERVYREKIDLLAPHGLSGAKSAARRGVPLLKAAHGALTVGNAVGLELATRNRSRVLITDFVDPALSVEVHVADVPALILAKGSKVGERLETPRKGQVRDKDLGDLWRLLAVADPGEVRAAVISHLGDPQVGDAVRRSTAWTTSVLRDPLSRARVTSVFDTFVDPAAVDDVFDRWQDVLPE